MNPASARRLLEALRRGDKKTLDRLRFARAVRVLCPVCGQNAPASPRGCDFDEPSVTYECSECGALNRLSARNWRRPETFGD